MENTLKHLQDLFTTLTASNLPDLAQDALQHAISLLTISNITELSTTSATSFALIAAAEIGDKSQLVCMTLAAKHKALPVLLGAIAAFVLLNSLAVVFGAAIASWLPAYIVAATVAVLFAAFGLHALRVEEEDEDTEVKVMSGHGIFLTTFLLITLAEFGDKTQLAVVALSSTTAPLGVWLGSTLALASTSAMGIIAGRTLLQKIPLVLLHKISGGIFLVLAGFAAYQAYSHYFTA
ncbi:TMEM165/GDT1 family protein [Methylovulum miyakonense]|uniref:TMEM165/GDT1 family protein n=1 Tax=Methylovulum miyakonense TaxID=645578 RepID=UPI00036575DB|nr:TMEM165/GDT1 family protein [Methylovulum miyakonense]